MLVPVPEELGTFTTQIFAGDSPLKHCLVDLVAIAIGTDCLRLCKTPTTLLPSMLNFFELPPIQNIIQAIHVDAGEPSTERRVID